MKKYLFPVFVLLVILSTSAAFACEFLIIAKRHWMESVDRSGWSERKLDTYRASYRKGDIVHIYPNDHIYGTKETLPTYIIVKVPDITMETARQYMDKWKSKVTLSQISYDPETSTYVFRAEAQIESISQIEKIQRRHVKKWIENHGGTILSHGDNWVEVEWIGTEEEKIELRNEALWALEQILRIRKFHISEARVDEIIAAGGIVTLTPAQALAIIRNKLDEENP